MTSEHMPVDPEFDALLAQTEALRRRYGHATAQEGPTAAADARIRSAAWQAVGATAAPTPRSWWHRLRVPVSIAAVLVLTMSAMLSMLRDTGERSLPDPSPRAKAPASPVPIVVAEAARASPKAGRSPVPEAMETRRPTPSAAPSAARPVDSGVPAPADPGPLADAASGERARREIDAVVPPLAAPRSTEAVAPRPAEPSAPSAAIAMRRDAAGRDAREQAQDSDTGNAAPASRAKSVRLEPGAWLERIRGQWISGAHEAAGEQMAVFRREYPAYPVPKDFPVPVPPVVVPDR